jgi:hypothetical protein
MDLQRAAAWQEDYLVQQAVGYSSRQLWPVVTGFGEVQIGGDDAAAAGHQLTLPLLVQPAAAAGEDGHIGMGWEGDQP